jgi:carbon storage regulator CsrA
MSLQARRYSGRGLRLTRKSGEKILIGDDIELTVVDAASGRAKLCINAPPEIRIRRDELPELPAAPAA